MPDEYLRTIGLISYFADPYMHAVQSADHYLRGIEDEDESTSIDDLFTFKIAQSRERARLILGDVYRRKKVNERIIESLTHDLVRINNWRLEIPFPKNYYKDQTWLDLNKMEMQIRNEIRAEKSNLFRDTAPLMQELRDALMVNLAEQKNAEAFDVSDLETLMDIDDEEWGEPT